MSKRALCRLAELQQRSALQLVGSAGLVSSAHHGLPASAYRLLHFASTDLHQSSSQRHGGHAHRLPSRWQSRGFAASGGEAPQDTPEARRVREALDVLQHIQLVKLREDLASLSEQELYISNAELLQMCMDSQAAKTPDEAAQIAQALDTAGFIMRFRDKVYLRPAEIASMVLQAVPDSTAEIERELSRLQAELAPLLVRKREVDEAAHRRTQLGMWSGLGLATLVWAACLRLTFWELSWDVMEPVTYFLGTATGLLIPWLYFLMSQQELGFKDWKRHQAQKYQQEGYQNRDLDVHRVQLLTRQISRYQRYLENAIDIPEARPHPA